MFDLLIGIDLGTTNSAVAYMDDNGNPQIIANREGGRVTPSVILFEEEELIVGAIAKSSALADPLNTAQFIKRQMGNEEYAFITEGGNEFTTEELSAIIIKRLKEDAEDFLGQKVTQAVISVPAYYDDSQRKATQDAGKMVGLEVLKIINEPTAAALGYGLGKDKDENILVYDLGGGTFDATLMNVSKNKIEIKSTHGDKNLGGFDFDNKIIEHVCNLFKEKHDLDLYDSLETQQLLRERAEMCKIQLSSRRRSKFSVSHDGITETVEITREDFEDMISTLLAKTDIIIGDVLDEASMSWNDIDKILLVGGSTRSPFISERLEKTSGIKPSKEVNPDEIVAIGAILQGLMLDETQELIDIEVVDVNSHSIGISSRDSEKNIMENTIILKRNSPIPASNSRPFYLTHENQEDVKITINEGEDLDLDYVKELGSTLIELPEGLSKGTGIEIEIAFDENQIVHMFARLEETGEYLGEMHIERKSNLTQDEIRDKSKIISEININ